MQLAFSAADEAFRSEVAAWMGEHLRGEFECLRHRGGPGDEEAFPEVRKAWERELAAGRWTCVGWPVEHGGRGLIVEEPVSTPPPLRAAVMPPNAPQPPASPFPSNPLHTLNRKGAL